MSNKDLQKSKDFYNLRLKDLYIIAGYHIENGINNFPDLSKKMIEDVGTWIIPHLSDLWEEVKEYATGKNSLVNLEADYEKKYGIDRTKEPKQSWIEYRSEHAGEKPLAELKADFEKLSKEESIKESISKVNAKENEKSKWDKFYSSNLFKILFSSFIVILMIAFYYYFYIYKTEIIFYGAGYQLFLSYGEGKMRFKLVSFDNRAEKFVIDIIDKEDQLIYKIDGGKSDFVNDNGVSVYRGIVTLSKKQFQSIKYINDKFKYVPAPIIKRY